MANRLELHKKFCEALGNNNAYYQPPASLSMKYPCIVYSISGVDVKRANDDVYNMMRQYQATVISKDADCEIPFELIKRIKMCRMDRRYVADNLYHTTFTIYY